MGTSLHPVTVERAVLGNLLLKEGSTLPLVEEILDSGSWGSAQHSNLWAWVCACQREGKAVSIMALLESRNPHELGRVYGGADYLESLADRACLDTQLSSHAAIISDAARARHLQEILERTQQRIGQEDVHQVLADHEQAVMRVTTGPSRITSVRHISDFAQEARERAAKIAAGDISDEYVPTGFPSMDKVYIGWPIGYTTVLGGRPKMGKTSFALASALRGASDRYGSSVPQGIITIEMPGRKLLYRLASTWSGVPWKRMLKRDASPDEADRFNDALSELGRIPIYLDDSVRDSASVCSAIRRMSRMHGCRVVYLDYFQLIKTKSKDPNSNMTAGWDALSDELRNVAKEEDIALVILAQFNKDVEQRGRTRGRKSIPKGTDFRNTEKLLMDAGLASGVYREFAYHPPAKMGQGHYEEDELAELFQPIEFLNLGAREGGVRSVELYVRLSTGLVRDPMDSGWSMTPWTGRVVSD